MEHPVKTLKQLGLSMSEASVYLAMVKGHTKVKEIMQSIGMKRPSVYYAISQLEKRGLIGRIQVGEYNQWKVSPFDQLEEMLRERKAGLLELEGDLESFIKGMEKDVGEHDTTKVTYYEGQKSIESVVFESLYCKNKEILSIAPKDNFFFQVGEEFATKYVNERKRRGIKTHNLWEELLDPKILRDTYKGISEVRILPKSMQNKFHSTVFIYDNKVMYVGPLESNYAVVFESNEHSKMMTAVFETMWGISRPAFK